MRNPARYPAWWIVVAIGDQLGKLLDRRPTPPFGKFWERARIRGHWHFVFALPLVVLRRLPDGLEPREFGIFPAAAALLEDARKQHLRRLVVALLRSGEGSLGRH